MSVTAVADLKSGADEVDVELKIQELIDAVTDLIDRVETLEAAE